ncbi:MAG: hypothetical protein QOG71_2227 [Pyrinomonadaceae bacterium]|nr:hypothetical protein [Pyrinomonadaceae bacterium]
MPAEYVAQRIRKEVVESLRKCEKKQKLKPSISSTKTSKTALKI